MLAAVVMLPGCSARSTLTGGEVMHTRLEVDRVAGFDGNGGAIVAGTPACKARYQP